MKKIAICLVVLGGVILGYALLMRGKIIVKEESLKREKRLFCEYGYFEGQKDYSEGDIRLKKKNGKYIWIKSCWDDAGTNKKWQPIYHDGMTEKEQSDYVNQ